MAEKLQRWYPSANQLKDPQSLEKAFRQVLEQHYSLVDRASATNVSIPNTSSSGAPPGSGPTDSMLLGLRVAPVDSGKLANGATLRWNKLNGHFEVS